MIETTEVVQIRIQIEDQIQITCQTVADLAADFTAELVAELSVGSLSAGGRQSLVVGQWLLVISRWGTGIFRLFHVQRQPMVKMQPPNM